MSPETVYLGRDERPPGLEQIASGKVRDVYTLDAEHLLFVTTDRVSAFDVIMDAGVPFKGAVLTAIAAHWFARTADIVPNHLVSTSLDALEPFGVSLDASWRARLHGRIMVVKRCVPDPIEWVVRGYLAGSGWKEYQLRQSICGVALPHGLSQAEALPRPILTPTTKNDEHDQPLSPSEARALIGRARFEEGERICLALFERGTQELARIGIRLADTKFELGVRDGQVLLIDEALTPDSSRFWDNAQYRTQTSPPSFDKQILRDYLETLDWDKNYPAPEVDPAILERVSGRYREICERITGTDPGASSGPAPSAAPMNRPAHNGHA
ncbi:MAG: phosphoribosylaminoimidazolesuccinocarboxamide synthase [Planctomycetota bacterium]